MYFNVTKCSSLILSCLVPFALTAKNATPAKGEGIAKPTCFIENKGQVKGTDNRPRADIQYTLSSPGMNLYVGNNGLHYQFRKVAYGTNDQVNISGYQMDVELLGANKHAQVINETAHEYVENYITGGTEGNFTAHSYSRVRYKEVYPGIDWVLYVKGNDVEYDFEVKPGADVHQIKLQYKGATALNATKAGGITAHTPMGSISENKPYAYEAKSGKEVTSRFVVKDNIVTFEAAPHTGTLVIDPTIQWSTYYGGAAEDVVTAVDITTSGIVFAAGYTVSTTNIATVGAFDDTHAGGYDAFVVGLNAAGSRIWGTYIGGAGADRAQAIVADAAGSNLYVAGYASSTTSIATATYQAVNGGGNDGFILRINPANGTRVWGTYYGGAGDDRINAMTLDVVGALYVAGVTSSPTAIASGGAYQTAISGPTDAFVAKFSSLGARNWGTYYGGSAQEEAFGIATDGSNNVIFTGQTNSVISIASTGAHQATLSGTNDAFIAKLNTTGNTRAWGTYYGGPGTEQGNGVVCNLATGAVSVVGNTTSATSIATTGAHQATYGGGVQDAFLANFTSAGVRNWATYYGGSSLDYGEEVTLDPANNIIIAGGTFSANGIASPLGNQITIAGDYDAYAAKFLPNSQRLWGTYFGGALYDYAFSVATNASGQMVIGGHTTSPGGIATTGVAQAAFAGGIYDGFVTKFNIDTFVTINQPYIDTILCAGGPSFNLPYTVNTNFRTGNNFVAQLSDASGSFATPIAIGSVTSNTSGTIPVAIPAGTPLGAGYRIRIVSTAPAVMSPDNFRNIQVVASVAPATATGTSPVCVGGTIVLNATAPYSVSSYSWNGPSGFIAAVQSPTITPAALSDAGTYSVTTTHNGCPATTSTVEIIVNSFIPPTPTVTATSPACLGSAINFTATTGLGTSPVNYSWTGPAGFSSTMASPTIASAAFTNSGTYSLVTIFGGCPSATGTVTVTVLNTTPVSVTIDVSPNDTVCEGTLVAFTATPFNGGISPTYEWRVDGVTVVGAISPTWSTTTLTDGDNVVVVLHSSVTCPSPINALSNVIKMNVINNAPIAFITASPGTSVAPGTNVTFTAVVFNGGTGALYQWQKNGVDIPGATNLTYTLMGVNTTDTIRMMVTSTMGCAVPATVASNSLVVRTNVGIEPVTSAFDMISLFPNPNSGSFTINGEINGGLTANNVDIKVFNAVGQLVYSSEAAVQGASISKQINLGDLSSGVYMMRLAADGQASYIRFTVSK